MAFPTVRSSVNTNGTTASATPSVSLPATIAGGDTIFVAFRSALAGAISWPDSTWNEMSDASDDASDDQMAFAWKRAVGGEGGTSITLGSANAKFAAIAFAIAGAVDPRVRAPETSTVATGTTTTPNATTCTPTGGAKDYLWLTFTGREGEATLPPTYPTNYTVSQTSGDSGTASTVGTNVRVTGAVRTNNNAASEDAGNWTFSDTEDWSAWTIAFHPNVELPKELICDAADPPPRTWFRRPNPWTEVAAGLALLTTLPDPFNQTYWPAPQPMPRPVVSDVNTRPSVDATFPFQMTEWPPTARVRPPIRPDQYQPVLQATLAEVSAPFTPPDLPLPARAPRAVRWNPPPNLSLLQETPFVLGDWPLPQRSRRQPPAFDWAPNSVLTQVAEIVPVGQSAVSPSLARRGDRSWAQSLLQSTLSDVVQPFSQTEWPRPQPIPGGRDRSYGANLVLGRVDEVVPVGQAAVSPSLFRRGERSWAQNLLQSTLQPSAADPFIPAAWPRPYRTASTVLSWTVFIIPDDSVPLIPIAWPRPQYRREWRDQTYGANLVLGRVAEALPVGGSGLSKPGFTRQPPPFDWAPNLILLQAPPIIPPFIPTAWPRPQRAKPQPAPFDWPPNLVLRQVAEALPPGRSATSRLTLRAGGITWKLNLLESTLADVIVPPFIPIEWPRPAPRRPQPRHADLPNNVLRQVAEALPFNQHQWPRPAQWRWAIVNPSQEGGLRMPVRALFIELLASRTLYESLLANRTTYADLLASRTLYDDLLAGSS